MKTKIDLSKCKVGQKVKLRNGAIGSLLKNKSPNPNWPFRVSVDGIPLSYTACGSWYSSSSPDSQDIIAILPLKSAKKAKPKTEPRSSADKAKIRAAIKLLEGLLK